MAKHHGKARPVTGDTSQLTVVHSTREVTPMTLPKKNGNGKWTVEKGRETDCPFCAEKYFGKRERRQDKRSKIKKLLEYAKANNIQI